jgi:hypothetical protein
MKIAINLYDKKIADSALLAKKAAAVADEVNEAPLGDIPTYALRKIPDMEHALLKRSFSYLPGTEAYPEVCWAVMCCVVLCCTVLYCDVLLIYIC